MDDKRDTPISRAERLFAKADKARARRGLPTGVEVGFDYATTIKRLHSERNYDYRVIADCIGCTHQALLDYRDKGTIPNHIVGEMLCALWEDEYGRYDANRNKTLPMRPKQEAGGIRVARLGRVNKLR